MPPVVTLDDLTAMMAADEHHRYMHHLDDNHYAVRTTMPLAWVLNTSPAEHDLA